MIAIAHNNLGNATRELGDLTAAADHYASSLRAYRQYRDRWALAILYEDVAALAALTGDAEVSLMLSGAADTLRDQLGSPRSEAQQEAMERRLSTARRALGNRAEDLLRAGRELSEDAAFTLAQVACATG